MNVIRQQLTSPAGAAATVRGAPVNGALANAKLVEIAKVLDDGIVKVVVGEILPLGDARKARELA